MASLFPIAQEAGVQRRFIEGDVLLTSDIDRATAGVLTLGNATANAITIGSAAITTTFPGAVDFQGVTTITDAGTLYGDGPVFLGNNDGDTIYIGGGGADLVELRSSTTLAGGVLIDLHTNGGDLSLPDDTQAPAVDGSDGYLRLNTTAVPDVLEFLDVAGGAWVAVKIAAAGNTLDMAYDQGGAGVGRSVTIDSGPVYLDNTGGVNNHCLEIAQSSAVATDLAVNLTGTGSRAVGTFDGDCAIVAIATGAVNVNSATYALPVAGATTGNCEAWLYATDAGVGGYTGTCSARVDASDDVYIGCSADARMNASTVHIGTVGTRTVEIGSANATVTIDSGAAGIDVGSAGFIDLDAVADSHFVVTYASGAAVCLDMGEAGGISQVTLGAWGITANTHVSSMYAVNAGVGIGMVSIEASDLIHIGNAGLGGLDADIYIGTSSNAAAHDIYIGEAAPNMSTIRVRGNSTFGGGGGGHIAAADGNVQVTDLEVNSELWINGVTCAYANMRIEDTFSLVLGDETDVASHLKSDNTNTQILLALHADQGRNLIITDYQSVADNHGHIAQYDPTLWWHGHNRPTTNPNEYGCIRYYTDATAPANPYSEDLVNNTVEMIGEGSRYTLHENPKTLADNASFDLPDATCGWGFVFVGDREQWAHFCWRTTGSVVLMSSSGSVTTTAGMANSFNIYDNGTQVTLENKLGATKSVMFDLHYTDNPTT